MSGRLVEFVNGKTRGEGYLATPASGRGPGVIVMQEWWGLVGHIKTVCDRLAAEGFVALAPDLYHGESTTSPDDADKLMMALDIDRAARDMGAAIDHLLGLDATTGDRVGTVGFCMGGQLSLYAACANKRVGACVDFYGVHPAVEPKLDDLRAPFLGFFAEHDGLAPPEVARSLEASLQAAGKSTEIHIYEGADHAFFNDDRPEVYHAEYAADAWKRMIDFFRANLS